MSDAAFDDRDGLIWFDGEFVPWRDAKVHVLTHAMHYASSVFEGQRAYGGEVFRLQEHNERLHNSARLLDFEIPWTVEQLNEAARETLKVNNLVDAYMRPVAWRGSEQMGVSAQLTKIHVAIAAWEWPAYFTLEARMRGLRLTVSKWQRPNPASAPCHSKAAGLYMICTMSKHAAENAGYDDAIMYDYKGRIAEATGAHVFFIKGDEIHTPTTECVLEGITRVAAMELAEHRGFKIIERDIYPQEMAEFEQAFLSGTAAEISPLSEIGEYKFVVGDACATLMRDYDNLVNRRDLD